MMVRDDVARWRWGSRVVTDRRRRDTPAKGALIESHTMVSKSLVPAPRAPPALINQLKSARHHHHPTGISPGSQE